MSVLLLFIWKRWIIPNVLWLWELAMDVQAIVPRTNSNVIPDNVSLMHGYVMGLLIVLMEVMKRLVAALWINSNVPVVNVSLESMFVINSTIVETFLMKVIVGSVPLVNTLVTTELVSMKTWYATSTMTVMIGRMNCFATLALMANTNVPDLPLVSLASSFAMVILIVLLQLASSPMKNFNVLVESIALFALMTIAKVIATSVTVKTNVVMVLMKSSVGVAKINLLVRMDAAFLITYNVTT
jgi:hypothetical protein